MLLVMPPKWGCIGTEFCIVEEKRALFVCVLCCTPKAEAYPL